MVSQHVTSIALSHEQHFTFLLPPKYESIHKITASKQQSTQEESTLNRRQSDPVPHLQAHSTAMSHLVVGGDVGGTNSRLALYKIPASKLALIEGRT